MGGDSIYQMVADVGLAVVLVLIPVMPFDTCDDMHSPPEAILISATVAASAEHMVPKATTASAERVRSPL